MARLYGTIIANQAINYVNRRRDFIRLYTQKRVSDRSHKIYGCFEHEVAKDMLYKLESLGAINPRIVMQWARGVSIRFETAGEYC